MKFQWERIDYREREMIRTWRAKVPGGWVLRAESWWDTTEDSEAEGNFSQSESMVFIPDAKQDWNVND
jgi:hypothetical protein